MTTENLRIHLMTKDQKAFLQKIDSKEYHYQIDYSISPIPEDLMAVMLDPNPENKISDQTLGYPPKNVFLPKRLCSSVLNQRIPIRIRNHRKPQTGGATWSAATRHRTSAQTLIASPRPPWPSHERASEHPLARPIKGLSCDRCCNRCCATYSTVCCTSSVLP